jgi:hypothetical protein
MFYFCITLKEKKGRRRRKYPLKAETLQLAKIAIIENCDKIEFEPIWETLSEVIPSEYEKILANLLGKRVY